MRHAERGEQRPLLGRAGGGEHDRARLQGHLDRHQPDAAGAGMDQHALSRLHLRQRMQRMVDGEEGDGDLRRLLEAEVAGLRATKRTSAVMWVARLPAPPATTSSPTANSVTWSPTATTRPAHSRPGSVPPARSAIASAGSIPIASIRSMKLRPAAATSISTSCGPGPGRGSGRAFSVSRIPGRANLEPKRLPRPRRPGGPIPSSTSSIPASAGAHTAARRAGRSRPRRSRSARVPRASESISAGEQVARSTSRQRRF